MADEKRTYDVVIFGATGYTGRYVVEEALKRSDIKFAVAGRNEEKLKKLIDDCSGGNSDIVDKIGVIVAAVDNNESLVAMCKSTKVLISCVGPYRFYGKPVLKACVETSTHYVDVSGEPQFLEEMQCKYFEMAKSKKLYIVGSCGVDSIPCDSGIQHMKQHFDGLPYSVDTYLQFNNKSGTSANFATWQSAVYGVAYASELKKIRSELNRTVFKNYTSLSEDLKFTVKNKKRFVLFKKDNRWCIPFPGSDKSVSMRSQRFQKVHNAEQPVQVKTYLSVPSLGHALGAMFLGLIFFTLASFKLGRYLLEKYPVFFSAGTFRKDAAPEEPVYSNFSLKFEMLGWDKSVLRPVMQPDKLLKCLFYSPVGPYKATAIFAISSANVILKEGYSSKMPDFGVLTPGVAFCKSSLVDELETQGLKYTFVN